MASYGLHSHYKLGNKKKLLGNSTQLTCQVGTHATQPMILLNLQRKKKLCTPEETIKCLHLIFLPSQRMIYCHTAEAKLNRKVTTNQNTLLKTLVCLYKLLPCYIFLALVIQHIHLIYATLKFLIQQYKKLKFIIKVLLNL